MIRVWLEATKGVGTPRPDAVRQWLHATEEDPSLIKVGLRPLLCPVAHIAGLPDNEDYLGLT